MHSTPKFKVIGRIITGVLLLLIVFGTILFIDYQKSNELVLGEYPTIEWGDKGPEFKQTASIELFDFLEKDEDDIVKILNNANAGYESSENFVEQENKYTLHLRSNKVHIVLLPEHAEKDYKVAHIIAYYDYTKNKTDYNVLGINGKTKKSDAIKILKKYGEPYVAAGVLEAQDIVTIIFEEKYLVSIEFIKKKVSTIRCDILTE